MISSPLIGELIPLKDIEDTVFASGAVGKGVAIKPNDGDVYSPITGQVALVFPTKHAIGLKSDDGVEVLIHIGMDTVELNGEGFEVFVSVGDNVELGQRIAKVDLRYLESKGKYTITPVVITNADDYDIHIIDDKRIVNNDSKIMRINK